MTTLASATDTYSSPMDALTQLLRNHFDTNAIVPVKNPWDRIMDGMIVDIHVSKWAGAVTLSADDLGLDPQSYTLIQKSMTWGKFFLLGESTRMKLDSLETQARQLPKKYGRQSHWGFYVPVSAVGDLRESFAKLEAEWKNEIKYWLSNYKQERQDAQDRVAVFATRAWSVANAVGTLDRLSDKRLQELDAFVDRMVTRIMAFYPSKQSIRERYQISLSMAYIPTPSMEAEQAAHVEQVEQRRALQLEAMRRQAELKQYEDELAKLKALDAITVEQAKQREKLRLIAEHNEKLRSELDKKAAVVVKQFYRDYALHVRQMLHESLSYAIESVRTGRLNAATTRSVRVAIEAIRTQIQDGDTEMEQMVERLSDMVQNQKAFDEEALKLRIEDLGVLLQTEIIALGDSPRRPKRLQDNPIILDVERELPDPIVLESRVRDARKRLTLDATVAEMAIETGAFEVSEARTRRARLLE